MLTSETLLSRPGDRTLAIGIGAGEDKDKVVYSMDLAKRAGFTNVMMYDDAAKLARDLREGRLDAAVRGDLGSNQAMAAVRQVFGVSKVLRAAFMEPERGRMFLLAPVGIDEGWTAEEKVELATLSAALMKRIGVSPVVGIMSGGRSSDRGRKAEVDRTIDDAARAVASLHAKKIEARDVQILIEEAARDCDIIIAPDGISGNLIFRTLHFLGRGKALGAPILNIGKIYIDTSRAKESYLDSIALAAALAAGRD